MADITYLHPHMQTSIVDNSAVVPQQATSGTVMFMPYFSSRGVDGEIRLYNSYSEFILENGTPNFRKHGQAVYNILQFLRAGGSVYGMRIVPDDAAAAMVKLGRTVNAETGAIEEDPEGDLLVITCLGKGEYGNKFQINIRFNQNLADGYGFAVYDLSVIESGRVIEGPYYVALNPEARDTTNHSMYIKNVIETYSETVKVQVNEEKYDELIESLAGEEEPMMIDVLGAVSGIELALQGGLDGSPVFGKGEDVVERRSELLTRAFSHPDIVNKKRYPIDVLMDANFDNSVKVAMAALANKRADVFCFFDLTTLHGTNAEIALKGMESLVPEINERKFAVYGQTFVVYDSFTNSDINVTMPYLLCAKIPAHDDNYGIQYPIAGPNRGILTGFKTMSFNPTLEEKEALYKAKVNYAENDYRNTKLMSQLTAQGANTALSNINNMRVLLRMIRNVEEISENYFFEFANASTLANFQASINNYLSTWVANGACTTCSGSVYQNAYDVAQKIVRVRVEIVFTGIIERIVIEFNVGATA